MIPYELASPLWVAMRAPFREVEISPFQGSYALKMWLRVLEEKKRGGKR
jgi:hypothetical protein